MCGSPTVQAAFEILRTLVSRWCAYVLQLLMRLKVNIDHGQGRMRSGAGCPPFESSGANVHIQPTTTTQ